MTPASAILAELRARGVRIEPRPHGGIRLVPARMIDSLLLDRIREHKAALLACFHIECRTPADKALALLNRLKTYTLPAGRMAAASEIAQLCGARLIRWENGERVDEVDDPASILAVLRDIERGLIALGGVPDRELAEAIGLVKAAFPDARLIEVKKLQR